MSCHCTLIPLSWGGEETRKTFPGCRCKCKWLTEAKVSGGFSPSLFPCPTSAWLNEVINHWRWCVAGRAVRKEVTNKQLWGKGKVSYPAGIWLTSHDEGQAHSLLWWFADRPLWATTFPTWVENFIFFFPWWSVIKTDGREPFAPFKVLIVFSDRRKSSQTARFISHSNRHWWDVILSEQYFIRACFLDMRATEELKLPLSLQFKLNERQIHTNESLALIVAALLDGLA